MSEPEYKLTMRFGHSFTRPECMGTIIEGGGPCLPEPPPSMWPIYALAAVGAAANPPVFLISFMISFIAARARQ